ncbi:hypothetical protein V6Z11_D11G096900 [Gossypium hirsutum]
MIKRMNKWGGCHLPLVEDGFCICRHSMLKEFHLRALIDSDRYKHPKWWGLQLFGALTALITMGLPTFWLQLVMLFFPSSMSQHLDLVFSSKCSVQSHRNTDFLVISPIASTTFLSASIPVLTKDGNFILLMKKVKK